MMMVMADAPGVTAPGTDAVFASSPQLMARPEKEREKDPLALSVSIPYVEGGILDLARVV
jgi:hypothetical protein